MLLLWTLSVCLVVASASQQADSTDKNINLRQLVERELFEYSLDKRGIQCKDGEFSCDLKGEIGCLPFYKFCDGVDDCAELSGKPGKGFDERHCSMVCGGMSQEEWEAGYFCYDRRKCISAAQKCDATVDCEGDPYEGSDTLCQNKRELKLRELLESFLADAEN